MSPGGMMGPGGMMSMSSAGMNGTPAPGRGLESLKRSENGRFFSYSTSAMACYSGIELKIVENEGKLTAAYRHPMEAPEMVRPFEVDEEFFQKVTEIIDRYQGDAWDGFNWRAQGVYDGTSFRFTFEDGKGRNINASGYMTWPEGFSAAMREITELFDQVYRNTFPNLFDIMTDHLRKMIEDKFGDNYRETMKNGDLITKIPFLYAEPGYMFWGENPMPEGVLGFLVTGGYEGADPMEPGYRAVVVEARKEPVENSSVTRTNLWFSYYGIEQDLEVRHLQDIKVKTEAVIGHSGEVDIFHFGSPTETTIGLFDQNNWESGPDGQRVSFSVFHLAKDEIVYHGCADVTIPREELNPVPEKYIIPICDFIGENRLAGMSNEMRNRWIFTKTISCPLVSPFVAYRWHTVRNGELQNNEDGSLTGKPIEGWNIQVFRK
ncbi:MAG: hypothetical protein J5825_07590 [Lachnospiraceae bacterium]|nr:hypothetical protein [Lachnospiraceae bacterium]